MPLLDRISGHFKDSAQIHLNAVDALAPAIEQAARHMVHCLAQGGKILACGNGGSAADAQHFVSKMINRFEQERPGLAAIALTADTSTLTSIANDHAYEQVFARQVKALGQPGDILLAISTSGNSQNVLEAVTRAKKMGISTLAFAGGSGGKVKDLADFTLCVSASTRTSRVQETLLVLEHLLCQWVEGELFSGPKAG